MRMIKNKAEYDELLASAGDKLVVIDFTATWCGPCQMIAPIFEQLSQLNPNAARAGIFVKVDVDEASDVAQACGISAMPTFHFYKNGAKVHEMRGADQNGLAQAVQRFAT